MNLLAVFSNPILIAGFTSWGLAQLIKVPWNYFSSGMWDLVLLLRAGGMPSSHSALVASVAHATGIRRQAGKHAEYINRIIRDRLKGVESRDHQLREMLGHTPLEALAGTVLGVAVAQAIWLLW
jgi:acid phosphatase family membrane protein YuiD